MINNKEEILKEFNKKFPELWSSNDGREGYDSRVESDVMDFLLSVIDRVYEEGRKKKKEKSTFEGGVSSNGWYKIYKDDLDSIL